jgi:large subunit ribosomal protein L35
VQEQSQTPGPLDLDPNTVLPEFEAQLMKEGRIPIGSRRRRVAMRTTGDLAFEQLPYQTFQEARKILAADRQEKLDKIKATMEKIAALENEDASKVKGGEKTKNIRLGSLRKEIERLKIIADINDPLVKKRFEDGLGMSFDLQG